MSRFYRIILFSLLIFSLGFIFGPKPLLASLDKKTAKTGEIFTYTLKIEGYFKEPVLTPPNFANLKVVSSSQKKNYSRKKGKEKLTMILTYSLFASKAGVIKIKPVLLKDQGRKYKSNAVVIKIIGQPLVEKRKITPYILEGTDL